MQLSFKLGLRFQEIALLRIREVAELGSQYSAGYHIKDVLVLPKSFTKGARALEQAGIALLSAPACVSPSLSSIG